MFEQYIKPNSDKLLARLLSKIDKSEGGCWNYTGLPVLNSGYRQFHVSQTPRPERRSIKITAHRLSYMLHNDSDIADGLCVCHSCDNKSCINPDHLWLGTHKDNLYDMYAKGRKPVLVGIYRTPKIPKEVYDKISDMYSSGNYFRKDVAKAVGLSKTSISRIIDRMGLIGSWKQNINKLSSDDLYKMLLLRKSSKLSNAKIAKIFGVSEGFASAIFRGEKRKEG